LLTRVAAESFLKPRFGVLGGKRIAQKALARETAVQAGT